MLPQSGEVTLLWIKSKVMDDIKLGLKENLKQFSLLVIVNAFVGGMIGLERSILPRIAEVEFHIAAKTAILSFIVVFGIVKAITNYYTGTLANKVGRKNLLVLGWLIGIPVPFILMNAPNWNWIIAANILLGIHQGLTWSSTVVMKIDLVGEKERGFAMGLNEFAGYISVAIVAFLTGWIASNYGLRPYPFYIGIILSFAGLLSSWLLIKDTRHHVTKEGITNNIPKLKNTFWDTTLFDRNLGSVTQAGLINNLNDGMVWGLFPILLYQKNFNLIEIGIVTAIYPAVWGIGQLFTGKMSDLFCKKSMLFWGMFLQGTALLFLIFASTFIHYIILSVVLGWGTAMVYPTFLATVAENTHPQDRAKSLGTFRFWRDLGYAVGAILTGIIADTFGITYSILVIALLTIASSFIIEYRMRCRTDSIKLTEWFIQKLKGKQNEKKDFYQSCRLKQLLDINKTDAYNV
jgi:MFS family permease